MFWCSAAWFVTTHSQISTVIWLLEIKVASWLLYLPLGPRFSTRKAKCTMFRFSATCMYTAQSHIGIMIGLLEIHVASWLLYPPLGPRWSPRKAKYTMLWCSAAWLVTTHSQIGAVVRLLQMDQVSMIQAVCPHRGPISPGKEVCCSRPNIHLFDNEIHFKPKGDFKEGPWANIVCATSGADIPNAIKICRREFARIIMNHSWTVGSSQLLVQGPRCIIIIVTAMCFEAHVCSCPQDTLEIEKQSMFAGSNCNLETVLRNIILCPRKPVATTIYPKWVHESLSTWNMSANDIQNIGNHINTYLQLHLKIGWRRGTEFHFCHQLRTETTPARRGYARSFIRIPAKFTFKNGSGIKAYFVATRRGWLYARRSAYSSPSLKRCSLHTRMQVILWICR